MNQEMHQERQSMKPQQRRSAKKEDAEKSCQARLETVRAEQRKYLLRVILVKVRESCKESRKIDPKCAGTDGAQAGDDKVCKPTETSGLPFPSRRA